MQDLFDVGSAHASCPCSGPGHPTGQLMGGCSVGGCRAVATSNGVFDLLDSMYKFHPIAIKLVTARLTVWFWFGWT